VRVSTPPADGVALCAGPTDHDELLAALVGVLAYGFLKKSGLARTWYDWALSALLYAWVVFTVAFVWTTFLEDEPEAAAFGGLVFGLVALVGFVVLRVVFTRRGGGVDRGIAA